MSRRIVGYEGEGRHRRPIYSDEGPAAAGAVSGLAAMGRLSALQIRETAGDIEMGAGRVERRQITADEDSARRAIEDRPSAIALVPPALGSPEHLQASRMRGAVRHQEVMADRVLAVVTGPTVSARTIEEEPVMEADAAAPEPINEPVDAGDMRSTLELLTMAARMAAEAWTQLEEARRRATELEGIWTTAREELEASWLATWLGFRSPLPEDVLPPIDEPVSEAERRHERLLHGELADIERSLDGVAVTTTFTETDGPADDASGIRTRRAAEGGPDRAEARPLTARQEKVLALLEANGGDRAAAARELGVVYQSVDEILEAVAKKGLLPIGLIAKLPARFAKYSVVGR